MCLIKAIIYNTFGIVYLCLTVSTCTLSLLYLIFIIEKKLHLADILNNVKSVFAIGKSFQFWCKT